MKATGMALGALLASTAMATAGGLDRDPATTGILFEEGTYLEFSYTAVRPEVSGVLAAAPVATGGVAPSYGFATLAYRQQVSENLSFALIADAPYGADVAYPNNPNYPFATSQAEVRTQQITAALRYQVTDAVSVYGGLRAMRAQANDVYVAAVTAAGPPPAGFTYRLDAESDWAFGYMLGAAYEIPEIALRVALTYFSEVDLEMRGGQGVSGTPRVPAAALPLALPANWTVTMPQSVLLEAQSGIAEDTLLFGSVRWTNWDGFAIVPGAYPTPTGALVDYDDDVWTWALGVGRRLTDDLSVSATVEYEAEQGGFSGNLGPTDGRLSIGVGAEYTIDNISIAGGIQYSWIGDAETSGGGGVLLANFRDNRAVAAGIRIGIQF
jgi:long-subunit fatty acid transport protein